MLSDYDYFKVIEVESTFMSIWLGLLSLALITTLFQCYKKSFLDDVVYRKHCRLWFILDAIWILIGSASSTEIITNFFGRILDGNTDLDNFLYFLGIAPKQLLIFFFLF